MKGLVLEYPMLFFLFAIVVVVVVGIIGYFYRQVDENSIDIDFPTDIRYLCIQLDDTVISFQDFQDVLYGFLIDQCNDFQARTKEKISITDIRRSVKAIDPSVQVIRIDACSLPKTNSHTVYVNFDEVKKNENIYLRRREIIDSDVLICD